jgi:Ribosomal protein S20
VSALDRAVAKGVLHRNNAARRKSRLMKRLQAASAQAPAPAPAASTKKASASGKSTRTKAATRR